MSGTNDNVTNDNNDESDNNTVVAIAGACAAVFLLILATAIVALSYYVCRKKRELDGMEAKLGNLNDVDRIMWAEMGRKDDTVTDNPAYGKDDTDDFAPLDVTAIEKEFDDEFEEEIIEEGDKVDGEEGKPKSSRLSILDTKTWSGMPGQKRKKKAPRKQIARTISRLEQDPEMKREVEKKFENSYNDGHYTLFNLNAGPNQRAVNMYEDGHLELEDDEEEGLPPKHIPSAGNRLLWQKKRFKDM